MCQTLRSRTTGASNAPVSKAPAKHQGRRLPGDLYWICAKTRILQRVRPTENLQSFVGFSREPRAIVAPKARYMPCCVVSNTNPVSTLGKQTALVFGNLFLVLLSKLLFCDYK
jgi:hypothetical protein